MVHISYIKCRLCSLTGDCLTVGLVLIDNNDNAHLFLSEKRMNIVSSLVNNHLFTTYVEGIQDNIGEVNFSFIERESRYQNGVVKITKPSGFKHTNPNDNHFAEKIFKKYIDREYSEKRTN